MKTLGHTWRFFLVSFCLLTLALVIPGDGLAENAAVIPVARTNANWIKRFEATNQRARQGNVDLIYVGDSIVEHYDNQGKEVWAQYYVPRNALNLGISGDRTEHVLWRLDHGNIEGINPKLAIVMIGQNNGGINTAEEIAEGMVAIVQRLRARLPDTKILLLAIFQRREHPTPERAVLDKASEIASKLADGKTIFYMDINHFYLKPDGSIPRDLMYDFEHPTPLGHRVWAETIETKVAELMGDKPIARTVSRAKPIRVLMWDEEQPEQKKAYGDLFLGETIARHLAAKSGISVKTANLKSPEQGLDEATLDATDVVVWWGHVRNNAVSDAFTERVVTRVKEGRLNLIALHSAHWSKPFIRLMQERAKSDALAQVPAAERATAKWEYSNAVIAYKAPKYGDPFTPSLSREGGVWKLALPICCFPAYRPDSAPSHVTTLMRGHPIAAGLPAKWDVTQTEMYDEPFHVPPPDSVVFEERWDKGEHFRSGCIWQVGQGRVFYFRPGHETYPVYKQAEPLRVIENAVSWLGNGSEKDDSRTGNLKTQVFNVLNYGAVGDDKTDNTEMFSACLKEVIEAGGGKMYLPSGVYRGRIIIPPVSKPLPSWITIKIVGESEPTPVFGTIGSFPLQNNGTIIRSLSKSGPAVITASRSTNSLYAAFSAVNVVIKNLDVRTDDNPGIGGIDLHHAMQCKIENVFINTGVYNVQASKPTHGTRGLITPACNNAALTILRNVIVTGYHTAIAVNEHTEGDNIVVASNINGLEFLFAHHASRFGRVGTYRNTHHITVSGRHGFSIAQMNTEQPGPGQTDAQNAWQTLVSDINDPKNLGVADINYWVVEGNVGAVKKFTRNGGDSIQARRIGSVTDGDKERTE